MKQQDINQVLARPIYTCFVNKSKIIAKKLNMIFEERRKLIESLKILLEFILFLSSTTIMSDSVTTTTLKLNTSNMNKVYSAL